MRTDMFFSDRPRVGSMSRLGMNRALVAPTTLVLLSVVLTGCASGADTPAAAALVPKLVKQGSLTVCTSLPYEPFEFEQKGEPAGFDIDLAGEVAKALKVNAAIVNTDFDQIQSGQLLNE